MDFSVLITVYAKDDPVAFKMAVESIFQQTLAPKEVILVQDGPVSPGLKDAALELSGKYSSALRIVTLPENIGLTGALNTGLRHCSSEWVARMDSDDISLPDRFEKQFQYLGQHPEVGILSAWIEEHDPATGRPLGVRKVPARHDEIAQFAIWRNPLNHMAVIFKKSLVLAQGGYPEQLVGFEDYGLWIKLLKAGCTFANVSEVLIYARAGEAFFKRRGGKKYFWDELRFLDFGRKMGFFSTFQYCLLVLSRTFLRLLPKPGLKKIYAILRRS